MGDRGFGRGPCIPVGARGTREVTLRPGTLCEVSDRPATGETRSKSFSSKSSESDDSACAFPAAEPRWSSSPGATVRAVLVGATGFASVVGPLARPLSFPPTPPTAAAPAPTCEVFFPLGEPVAGIRGCVIVWAGAGTEAPVLPPGAPLIWPSGRAFRASESGPCGATLDLATPSGASWEPLPASAPALPAAGGGGAYTSPAGFMPPCGTPYDGAPYTITGAYCPPTGKPPT